MRTVEEIKNEIISGGYVDEPNGMELFKLDMEEVAKHIEDLENKIEDLEFDNGMKDNLIDDLYIKNR